MRGISEDMREECEESVEGTDEEERRTLGNKLDVLLIITTINLHAQRVVGYARDVGCYILNDDVVPPTIAICRQNFAGFMAFLRTVKNVYLLGGEPRPTENM